MADPSAQPDGNGQSRKPSIHTLKLQSKGGGRKGLAKQDTDRFSAVLLTWDDPDADVKGTPEVRSRDLKTGKWSGWQKLAVDPSQADGAEGERAALRGGTESMWTGDADGVEVRLVNADGTEAGGQPAGLDVKLLDPGTDPKGTPSSAGLDPAAFAEETTAPATDSPTPTDPPAPTDSPAPTDTATDTATPTGTPGDTASASPSASDSPTASPSPSSTVPEPRPSTVVKPPIITQAEWGASTDYDGTPNYGTEIKAAVIHHTGMDSDNTLSCAQSRARMRSIQQEHFARGYYDIGYNFVVDRCGEIFEGRSGGMDLPVVGAHDVGFNTNTVGISYIGNFETAQPSRAALDAIARIVAWKFGMYGIDPTGKVTLTSGSPKGQDGNLVEKGTSITLPRVFGHRDTNATACPGKNLYPKLSLIAQLAKAPGVSHALATSDFNRDGVSDLVAGTPRANRVTVVPGSIDGPAPASKITLTQSSPGVPGSSETGDEFGASSAWGDVNGDGYADLAIGSPGEDDTSGNADRGQVTVMYGPALTTGFSYTTSGVTAAGAKLGSTVTVGDFNGDGKADVFSAGTGKGGNWNVRLDSGTYQYGTLTTATGSVAYLDAATGDFNRDGYADVALNYRDTGGIGRVVRFAGSASGLTKAGVISVKGGRSIAAGDVNGNGYDDIVIGQPVASESGGISGGQITMVPGTSTGFTTTGMTTIHQDTAYVPGGNESGDALGTSVSVGDYNADGYADVLAGAPGEDLSRSGVNYADAGDAILVKGTASGLTGSGSVAVSQDTSGVPGTAEAGDRLGSSVSLTDLSGYGRADLTFGADGEDGTDGILLHLPSNSTGLGYSDAVIYSKTTLGTPTDGRLGQTLTP
ncbi:FG-GAP-like repeat-containing protein [Streptomyces sp. S.PNR 29]|uniref:FG-GAP-like repeat-containing protein n=1 Tax=Streptomyces sp. S.PNR 29 TaxID=2973805 RepID=UPI0025B1AE8C|nr:FG-GAP-like repeat-containing protein [Streptomyces sp. S.PNR 29]MDN0195297.1 FG-GAP-like repeat-containing protein [Streptomyces sp. S.PNR 29]